MLDQSGKAVDLLAHVCVPGHNVDAADTGKIA